MRTASRTPLRILFTVNTLFLELSLKRKSLSSPSSGTGSPHTSASYSFTKAPSRICSESEAAAFLVLA